MEVAAFKIASFEIVDLQLIEKAAGTGKPLILSTGMASLSEIELAVETARRAGCSQLALLKCTSAYPARPEEMNLRVIPHLRDAFQVPVGLSDHTLGSAVAVAAVVLGACVVEKHFTVDRNLPGPDSPFSMTPQEFRDMVDAIRTAEKALGNVCYGLSASESPSLVFRRSLFVVEDMKAGDTFDESNLRAIRPGNGLPPKYLKEVLGRYAARDLERGMPLQWEDILGKRQA
jgi:N-acetylneuraminate synthase